MSMILDVMGCAGLGSIVLGVDNAATAFLLFADAVNEKP